MCSNLSSLKSKRLESNNGACKVLFALFNYLWVLILWPAINVLPHIKIVHGPTGKTPTFQNPANLQQSCLRIGRAAKNVNSQWTRVLAPTSTFHNSNFIFSCVSSILTYALGLKTPAWHFPWVWCRDTDKNLSRLCSGKGYRDLPLNASSEGCKSPEPEGRIIDVRVNEHLGESIQLKEMEISHVLLSSLTSVWWSYPAVC